MKALGVEAASASAAAVFADLHALCFPEPWDEAAFASLLAPPTGRGWLARRGRAVVGFIAVSVVGPEADLLSLGVSPKDRGRGVGRALLRGAALALAGEGVVSLMLEVSESNAPALALYASEGFEDVGRRPRYYSSGAAALVKRKCFAS